jgi:hypothetical protein
MNIKKIFFIFTLIVNTNAHHSALPLKIMAPFAEYSIQLTAMNKKELDKEKIQVTNKLLFLKEQQGNAILSLQECVKTQMSPNQQYNSYDIDFLAHKYCKQEVEIILDIALKNEIKKHSCMLTLIEKALDTQKDNVQPSELEYQQEQMRQEQIANINGISLK